MRKARIVVWLGLYAAFAVAAFLVRGKMQAQGLDEIWGWDYGTFVRQFGDWSWIGYFGFRHPGLGLVCSPLVVLQHVWSGAYLLAMPAVAVLTAWMIFRLSGWIGLSVWLTFPTTWLMASVPESFPIAQMFLVGSVCWLLNEKRIMARWGRRALPFGVGVFAAVSAAVTLTNGVKPVLAYLTTHMRTMDRKLLLRGTLAAVALAVAGVAFFYARTLMTGRGVGAGVAATLSWIPSHRDVPRELYGFFIRPVGLIQSFIVYPLACYAVCKSLRTRKTSALLLFASYFAMDFLIHGLVGWGMFEPWVFAPHWVWLLPLVIGRGLHEAHTCRQ